MRINQKKQWTAAIVFLTLVFLGTVSIAGAAATGTPMQAIIDLEKQLDSYKVGKSLTPIELAENRRLKESVIQGTFDVAELSRVSMSKHWTELSAPQQAEFVDTMTQLLQKKAIFSKEQSQTQDKAYRIKYEKEVYLSDNKDVARVYTTIFIPKDNVTLNLSYKLKRLNSEWKIFDVIVDDSSLVTNYQFQFHSIITKSGYPELLRRMKAKLSELNAKDPSASLPQTDAAVAPSSASPQPGAPMSPTVSARVEKEVSTAPIPEPQKRFGGCALN